jgi:hypothetical protein
MAKGKGKKKGFRSHKTTIPVAVVLGFVPLATSAFNAVKAGGVANLNSITPTLVPYNFQTRKIDFTRLGEGLYPIIAGLFVHKVVGGALGVNRALAAARIPWLRI